VGWTEHAAEEKANLHGIMPLPRTNSRRGKILRSASGDRGVDKKDYACGLTGFRMKNFKADYGSPAGESIASERQHVPLDDRRINWNEEGAVAGDYRGPGNQAKKEWIERGTAVVELFAGGQ